MADEVLAVDRGREDATGPELVASHQRAAHPAVGPPTNPPTHIHTILSEFKIWTSGNGSQTSCLQLPVYQLAWSPHLSGLSAVSLQVCKHKWVLLTAEQAKIT